MLLRNIFLSLGLLGLVGAAAIPENSTGSNPTSNELPTIDLGYAVYRASYYNVRHTSPPIELPILTLQLTGILRRLHLLQYSLRSAPHWHPPFRRSPTAAKRPYYSPRRQHRLHLPASRTYIPPTSQKRRPRQRGLSLPRRNSPSESPQRGPRRCPCLILVCSNPTSYRPED